MSNVKVDDKCYKGFSALFLQNYFKIKSEKKKRKEMMLTPFSLADFEFICMLVFVSPRSAKSAAGRHGLWFNVKFLNEHLVRMTKK